jgi:hypothetical protein
MPIRAGAEASPHRARQRHAGTRHSLPPAAATAARRVTHRQLSRPQTMRALSVASPRESQIAV